MKPAAPAYYLGFQEGFGEMPGFEIWNLTADIPGHPAGSSVIRATLENAGFAVPAAPALTEAAPVPEALAAFFAK